MDANGVDLVTGAFNLADPQASIGPSVGGLARIYENMKAEDNFYGAVNSSGSSYVVSIGASSETFTRSGNTFTSQQSDGSTLTLGSTGEFYTYVSSAGLKATFDTTYAGTIPTQANVARLTSLASPTGEVMTYTFQEIDKAIPGQTGDTEFWFWRQAGVSNNRGLSLTYGYQDNAQNAHTLTSVQGSDAATGATNTVTFSGNTATDALGRVTTYTLPAASSSQSITRPAGNAITIAYDSSSRVTSYANGVGTWSYSYSTSGTTQTTTVTDPNANKKTYVSNTALDVLTSYTDALNRVTSYTYDSYGRVTQVSYPHGNSVQYAYDTRGNVTTTTQLAAPGSGVANIVTSASYDASCASPAKCNKPNATTDARGNVTTYTYDTSNSFVAGGTGVLLSVTQPAQGPSNVQPQTRYGYMALQANLASGAVGSPIYLLTSVSSCNTESSSACIGSADETRITIAYDANHNLAPSSVTTAAGDGSVTSSQSFTYDSVGNLYTSTSPLNAVTRYRYDADRELVGVVGPDPDGGGPLKPTAVRLSYDGDGRSIITELGTVPSQADSDWANFSQAADTSTVYDTIGRPSIAYTATGATAYGATQYSYDNANRLICTAVRLNLASQPAACTLGAAALDGPDRITYRAYDGADEVTGVTDAYGTAQQRTQIAFNRNADGSVANVSDGLGDNTCYVYDGMGRLSQTLYAKPASGSQCNGGDYESYGYDAGSNVSSHRLRDGTAFSYSYDALNRPLSDGTTAYSYDNTGRITAAGNVSVLYDALGRKTAEFNAVGGVVRSAYDAAGNRTRMNWPDGNFVAYVRDPLGRVQYIEENAAGSGAGLLASYSYDSLGREYNVTYAGGTASLSQSFYFDPVQRLSMIGYGFADTSKNTVLGLNYTADDKIKVRTQTNSLYDWTGSYNFTQTYSANGLNQIGVNGAAAYSYNARGALSSDGVNTYSYSVYGQLTGVAGGTSATLAYDGLQRLNKTVGPSATTQFAYDGSMMLMEMDGSGNLLRRYVPGPDGTPLLWYEGSGLGDRRWLIKDQRGSVTAVANASGQTLALNTYDGYGLGGSSNLGRFQFAGRPFIQEVGLYDNAARSYSPTLGRFLQTDPIGYGDGLNWYAYAHGDPVNGTDPSGLDNEGGDDPCEYDACAQDGGGGDYDSAAETTVTCTCGGCPVYGATSACQGGVTLTGNYGAFLLSSPGGPGNSSGGGARGGMPAPQGNGKTQAPNPKLAACLQKAFSSNIGSVGLDAAGFLVSGLTAPESLLGAGAGLALTGASLINSAAGGDLPALGVGAVGYHLGALGPAAGQLAASGATSGTARLAGFLPGIGLLVSGVGLVHDLQAFNTAANACYASAG